MKAKKPDSKIDEIELVPDAWPRFERFIKQIAKAGPQHRAPTTKPKAGAKARRPGKRGQKGIVMDVVETTQGKK